MDKNRFCSNVCFPIFAELRVVKLRVVKLRVVKPPRENEMRQFVGTQQPDYTVLCCLHGNEKPTDFHRKTQKI